MWWTDYWPMPWMFFGPMLMIAIVSICVAAMFFATRSGKGLRDQRGRAIDILKERYARGEINQAEFEERRRFLEA